MTQPEYLGDPWRKFKAKVAREKEQKAKNDTEQDNYISVPTPGQESKTKPNTNSNYRSHKDRRKHK